jgi:glycosyltransferase involved in cell wall biosynthesis
MRILIDGRPLLEPLPTGVSRYARHLLDALFALPESREHTFVVYTNHAFTHLRTEIPRWDHPHVQSIHTRIPNKLLHTAMVLTGRPTIDWLAAQAGSGSVDAVLALNPHFLHVSPTVPLLLTLHDISIYSRPDVFSFKSRLWHHAIGLSRLVQTATHLFAVSESTAQDVATHWSIPRQDITTLTPAAPPIPMHHCDTSCPFAEVTRHIILCIGTREKRKNILGTLAAFHLVLERHPESTLVLLGSEGYGWQEAKQYLARHPDMMSRVRILGFADESTKSAALAHASVCLYPSWYEGFGIPILEAFAAHVPMVTSYGSALAESAGDAALFALPWRPDMLADAIDITLTDPVMRATLIAKGAARVTKFSWENSAKILLSQLRTYAHRD